MAHQSIGRVRVPRLVALLALSLVAAAPGTTLSYWVGDQDVDGVLDDADQCPGTPGLDLIYKSGDLVNPPGCSVCPCGVPWPSHDAYVSCVTGEANRRYLAGTLLSDQRNAVLLHAQNSTCGNPTVIRCCTWKSTKPGLGSCTVMVPTNCVPRKLRVRRAANWGSGSCYYNPCNG